MLTLAICNSFATADTITHHPSASEVTTLRRYTNLFIIIIIIIIIIITLQFSKSRAFHSTS